jgi:polyisoprenoid-binding protein YceI
VQAKGRLTLKGRTNDVSFELKARRNGANIEVNGTIPVRFADYGIDNPSGGPAQVGDEGEVEVLLVFAKA